MPLYWQWSNPPASSIGAFESGERVLIIVDGLADFLGMDIQTLNWIITGIFSILFGLGGTWILRLRDEVAASKEERTAKIEELRSDMRLQEKAQEQSAEQFRALFKLISEQIAVGNKMAENMQVDAERRFLQEQQRHELIKQFTSEQSKSIDAIEVLSVQIGKVNETVKETAGDAKASRALTIEVGKSVEGLTEAIRNQTAGLELLKTEVVAALNKMIEQPFSKDIRDALQEVERKLLQAIDKMTILIEEKRNHEEIAQPVGDIPVTKPA